ncbi:MAG: proline--tRNA ligase [Rickettsiales bacterium]|nr:proline--tRNA ligase [Rickettsiales bacterium]
MRLSGYFLPLIKENPSEAQVVSHRLMLRAGMIRQLSAGVYNWLPLGLRVLRNVERIVREEMDRAGAVELLMPTMQPAELWEESGRGDYGKETLIATDRHDRRMIYGPTNEEVITDIFRKHVQSYKQLPLNLYHIQWKFRDEIRPRFGVMRGREFLMKDAYTFTTDRESHMEAYDTMYQTYFKIFRRLGLKVIPFRAETGMIGGDMSHEFQVLAETGESEIHYDIAYEDEIERDVLDIDKLKSLYSAADEQHKPDECPVPADQLKSGRGIEVGHIFYLGDKYSGPMQAVIKDENGDDTTVMMGCHGIGISRLVGAIIEASHDDDGIVWPESVAPFRVGLINLRPGDEACDAACEQLYLQMQQAGVSVLYDDTDQRGGAKFASMDLIGLPWQVVVGPRGVANGVVELKCRETGEKNELYIEDALNRIAPVAMDTLPQL